MYPIRHVKPIALGIAAWVFLFAGAEALAQQPAPKPEEPPGTTADDADQEARFKALEDKIQKLEQSLQHVEEARASERQELLEQLRKERAAERAAAEKRANEAAEKEAAEKANADAAYKYDAWVGAPAPFAFADFSWIPGNYGAPERPFSFGPFTGEFRVDAAYHFSFNRPKDHTIGGSSEVFRHNELQLTQLGFGGDFFYKGVHGRLMTQFGMYSQTTPRNDASAERGQWHLADAYRYLSEAYGGYTIPAMNGINIQAGIFMSYVGLWSYYNFDNWTYQPSYVSSNTPWFFNGMRVQFFPSEHLKIEPWLVNGWQAYGEFNEAPGVGLQILWRPNDWLSILGNQYFGSDTLGKDDRLRIHTDDSIMVKYFDDPAGALSKGAASLTVDGGCEWDSGDPEDDVVDCNTQYFAGFMVYNRLWFAENKIGLTLGGGAITNPGRYLVLVPPINGATAFSGAAPHYTYNPGDEFKAWDMQITADYMPSMNYTFRLEFNHRAASIPYFTGHGGITPPGSTPESPSGTTPPPGSEVEDWAPDLVKTEDRLTAAFMLKL